MYFHNIIGNPPYQDKNQSIYNRFIEEAIRIGNNNAPNSCNIIFITKNNWFIGNTLQQTRDSMLDYGIKSIVNYPITAEIFPNISVEVCITLLVRGYRGNTIYTEIQHNTVVSKLQQHLYKGIRLEFNPVVASIITKITNHPDFQPYNLAKNARLFSIASNGKFMYADHTGDIIPYHSEKQSEDDVEVVFRGGARKLYSQFTSINNLPKGQAYIEKYKVVCGSKATLNNMVLSNIYIIPPNAIVTNSFGIVALTDTLEEAQNIYKYVKTRFYRFLVQRMISGNRVTYGTGSTQLVPLQTFTSQSDIEWSKNLATIDNQLYTKYGLDSTEIDCIQHEIGCYTDET